MRAQEVPECFVSVGKWEMTMFRLNIDWFRSMFSSSLGAF